MPQTLLSKSPGTFKTLPLKVQAEPQRLVYQAHGAPINFQQMLSRRQALEIADPHCFEVDLANLGVSVRLRLSWQGRDFWVLVRQVRPDRDDTVLKWISGYVPAHELQIPLLSAVQEVAEECLIESEHGWLAGCYGSTWLPTPYEPVLRYWQSRHFQLEGIGGAEDWVRCASQPLLECPRAYVHTPTASLQLVYDMSLTLPADVREPSLFHVDECLQEGRLLARLDRRRADLFLLELSEGLPTGELFTLNRGRLEAVSGHGLWLSEAFAEQRGWLVTQERVRFSQWRQRLSGAALA